MILETIPAVRKLSSAEKLTLASELRDVAAANPAEVPVPQEHVAELNRHMEAYRKNPEQVTAWDAIQRRIPGRTRGRIAWPELK